MSCQYFVAWRLENWTYTHCGREGELQSRVRGKLSHWRWPWRPNYVWYGYMAPLCLMSMLRLWIIRASGQARNVDRDRWMIRNSRHRLIANAFQLWYLKWTENLPFLQTAQARRCWCRGVCITLICSHFYRRIMMRWYREMMRPLALLDLWRRLGSCLLSRLDFLFLLSRMFTLRELIWSDLDQIQISSFRPLSTDQLTSSSCTDFQWRNVLTSSTKPTLT